MDRTVGPISVLRIRLITDGSCNFFEIFKSVRKVRRSTKQSLLFPIDTSGFCNLSVNMRKDLLTGDPSASPLHAALRRLFSKQVIECFFFCKAAVKTLLCLHHRYVMLVGSVSSLKFILCVSVGFVDQPERIPVVGCVRIYKVQHLYVVSVCYQGVVVHFI